MRTATAARAAPPIVSDGGHHGPLLDEVKGYKIIDCEPCGFRHVLPLPKPDVLKAAYAQAYYRDVKPDYVAHARDDADWSKLAWNDRLSLFEELLADEHKPLHVLDIGCGPGWFLKAAIARGWQARGIEPSEQAAAHAQSLGLNVANVMFDETTAQVLRPVTCASSRPRQRRPKKAKNLKEAHLLHWHPAAAGRREGSRCEAASAAAPRGVLSVR